MTLDQFFKCSMGLQKTTDGLKPNPNDSRWVALSVGPDVVNGSRTGALSQDILNAKNLAPPFLSTISGSKSMTSKINVL